LTTGSAAAAAEAADAIVRSQSVRRRYKMTASYLVQCIATSRALCCSISQLQWR